MSNLFTDIPATIIQGDTPSWPVSVANYPATDGWSLICKLVGTAGVITITAAASGADYLFTVTAATSAAWAVGSYRWQYYVEKGSGPTLKRVTVDSGTITIEQGFATVSTATDTRTANEKILDAIDAVIAGTATTDQQEITIDGTTIKRRTPMDLIKLRGLYAHKVWRERNPGKLGPAVRVTFGDPAW